jgi:hypothetical protein
VRGGIDGVLNIFECIVSALAMYLDVIIYNLLLLSRR